MLERETLVRRATTADAQALSSLSAAIFPLGCPANTKPEDLAEYVGQELTVERFRALLEDDRNAILAVDISNKLAGYALISRGSLAPHMQVPVGLELRKFYIEAAYHGRGVAHALMKEVLAIAANERDATLWLSVFSGNERAISFYKKCGFRIVGTQDFIVGADCQQDYLMQYETPINAKDGHLCK